MTKHSLRMKTRTEWWRQRNSLTGSWSNLASRFSFYAPFAMYLCKHTHMHSYVMYMYNLVESSFPTSLSLIWILLSLLFLEGSDFFYNSCLMFPQTFWMQKTSFMLFLNKFDIFEKKVLKVRVNRMVHNY